MSETSSEFAKKEHYAVHYRNLKLYVSLGLVVTKLHKVIKWMKSYIEKNTVDTGL